MSETVGLESPLRVLFDGYWWSFGPMSNRQVQREFVLTWLRLFPTDELSIAVKSNEVAAVQAEFGSALVVAGTHLSPQGVSAVAELPFIARRLRADMTVTHNFTPFFGKSAVFIHDFLFLSNPEWFTWKERLYFSLMPATIRFADLVLTSSESEAQRIARFGSITTIPTATGLGANRELRGATETAPPGVEGYENFVLAVGRLNTRKNLAETIAGALASGLLSPTYPLLVVGEASGKAVDLSASAQAAIDQGCVVLMGRVSDSELRWLYQRTALFLFLTLDEGFGLPTLEALEFGAPLLVSDIPVFREILGDNANYVDPRDTNAIAAAIRRAIAEPHVAVDRDVVLDRYTWERAVNVMRDKVLSIVRPALSKAGE
jgi:glycosyltransferase involved in cell wall biosynthesis